MFNRCTAIRLCSMVFFCLGIAAWGNDFVLAQNGVPWTGAPIMVETRSVGKFGVVAIRHLSFIVDDRTEEGESFERRLPHIELELYLGNSPAGAGHSEPFVQIEPLQFLIR